MPCALETSQVTLEVNDIPLSLCNDLGRPNLKRISWSSFFLFVCFFFFFFFFNLLIFLSLGRKAFNPSCECICHDQYIPSRNWHLGEVQLPALSQVCPMCYLGSATHGLPMGCASWGLRAPWGLFFWQVGQEETTCLIVVWRPAPLKDLSSNLWRAFSPI